MLELRHEIRLLAERAPNARVTVVRSGALGDTILLLPTVELLRAAVPSARITVVGSQWAERVAPLLKRPWTVLRFDSLDLLPLFAREDCADPSGAFRDAHLAVVYTPDLDDVFVRNVRRLCGATVIPHPVEPPPGVHAACHCAAALTKGLPKTNELPLPDLAVSPHARREAKRWLAGRLRETGGLPVVLHVGSGGEWKCWPAEHFAGLARWLTAQGAQVILIQGPADERASHATCERLPPNIPAAVGRFENLENAAALISRAALYVGNDSGITHLAAALGAPTVAVFGPTDPMVWRPLGRSVRVVRGAPSKENPSAWPTLREVCDAASTLLK